MNNGISIPTGQRAVIRNGKVYFEDVFKYTDIKTLDDAIKRNRVMHQNPTYKDEADFYQRMLGEAHLRDSVFAYAKLEQIARALNNGWSPSSKNVGYRPHFYLVDDIKNLPVQKILAQKKVYNKWIVLTSITETIPDSGKAYCPCSLACKTREIAEYFGRTFIELWGSFYYI